MHRHASVQVGWIVSGARYQPAAFGVADQSDADAGATRVDREVDVLVRSSPSPSVGDTVSVLRPRRTGQRYPPPTVDRVPESA